MAIARGPGTEIIRSAGFEDIDSTRQDLIIGEQHHIYTVLSIIIYCKQLDSVVNKFYLELEGYDSKGGTTDQNHSIFETTLAVGETFVWNDKFSFNGYEPVNFGTGGITAAPLSVADQQNAIADQAGSVKQTLNCYATHASDGFEVLISYIDQNNA